jgi:hypothetical protein
MDERLLINASSASELNYQLDLIDITVGGYIGTARRTNEQRERWVLVSILKALKDPLFCFPLEIYQSDAPDFEVCSDGQILGIEVTEAAPPSDARAWAIAEKLMIDEQRDYYFDSEVPLRNSGGHKSDAELVKHDIQSAIDRKYEKDFLKEKPIDLWIYPNSNASWWLTAKSSDGVDWENVNRVFAAPFDNLKVFRRAIVYFSSGNIWGSKGSQFEKLERKSHVHSHNGRGE